MRISNGEAWCTFLDLAALETDDCVEWPHSRVTNYGQVWHPDDRRVVLVHRLALEQRVGPPASADLMAAHFCHNPPCLNYRHLRWATRSENEQDKLQTGTHNRGARSGLTRLTWPEVTRMRSLHAEGMMQKDLAAMFSVGKATVSRIISQKTWKEVA